MKESPWFSPEEKPVRKGIYMVQYLHNTSFLGGWAYWDGELWGCASWDGEYPCWSASSYFWVLKVGVKKHFPDRYWKGIVK